MVLPNWAYMFRDNGHLVWSGLGYYGDWTANFRPDVFNGKPVLRATQGSMNEGVWSDARQLWDSR